MELNAMEPIMAFNIFFSMDIMTNAIETLIRTCITGNIEWILSTILFIAQSEGITTNEVKLLNNVKNSIGIVTVFNPFIRYDNACRFVNILLDSTQSLFFFTELPKLHLKLEALFTIWC